MQIFFMLMDEQRPVTQEALKQHTDHLKQLQENGRLILSGSFQEGGGLVLLRALNKKEARQIAESDPFIRDGYKSFTIRTLDEAGEENGFLSDADAHSRLF